MTTLAVQLYAACREHRIGTIKMLIEAGISINHRDPDGATLLQWACRYNHIEFVDFLITHNAEVNTQDTNGDSPLLIACECKQAAVVMLLLAHGADINVTRTTDGWTPLQLACKFSHIEAVCMMIERGANINQQNVAGWAPLHVACYNDFCAGVKVLLEYGADVHMQTRPSGRTPIEIANLRLGVSVETINRLIIAGSPPVNVTHTLMATPAAQRLIQSHRTNPSQTRVQLLDVQQKAILLIKSAAYQQMFQICPLDATFRDIFNSIKYNTPCDL
jgi:hypothetical protein